MSDVDQGDASARAETQPKKRRGFACMDRNVVSAIAAEGGRAAHAHGTAHKFTQDEARAAGLVSAARRRAARGQP